MMPDGDRTCLISLDFTRQIENFFLCCVGMTCPLPLLGWSQDQTVGGGAVGKDPSYGRFCIRIQPFVLGADRPIGGEWRMREVVTLSGLHRSHSSIQASRALHWYDTYQGYLSKWMHHAMYLVCLIRTHKTILRRVSFECCNEWRIQGRWQW